ncbi:MAG: nucleotide exchange factor GrpE [Ruminococcus sp.]|nr:nucleotide exchange factor GrpE [Ruminococcus sp.]MBQ8905736.1 nucleotide exchange factor GrpE [Ruminococcus sp.]
MNEKELTPEELEEQSAPETAEAEAEETAAEAEIVEEAAEEPDFDAILQEEKDKYLRLCAEYDNFRKRTAKEKSELYAMATAAAVEAILPAIDSFGLALAANCTDEAYKTGMEKIYAQLETSLKKLGVTEIESLGKEFDPNLHNAIKQVEDSDYAEGYICEVFQKGYMLGDRVVRHAMVAVAS